MDTNNNDQNNIPVNPDEQLEVVEEQNNAQQNTQTSDLEELQKKYDELDNKYKRLLAEKLNQERQFESQKAFSNIKFLEQIIDVKDDLDMLLSQVPEGEKESVSTMGLNMVYGKLMILLMTNEIKQIESKVGDEFDSAKHEAISAEENSEMQNKIVKIFRNGYMLRDRVIRPVRVAVGK